MLDEALLFAPEQPDVEVLSVLRRAVLGGRLDERRAALVAPTWRLWSNLSAYKAVYVAAARQYGATLRGLSAGRTFRGKTSAAARPRSRAPKAPP
jgi:hypothetical protein